MEQASPQAQEARSRERRPLRWCKFAAGLCLGALSLQLCLPALHQAALVLSGPFAEVASPLRLLVQLLCALAAAAALIHLTLDAALDWIAPRWLLAAMVMNLALVRGAPLPEAPSGSAAWTAAIHRLGVQAREELPQAASLHEGIEELRRTLDASFASRLRDRWLRPVEAELVILEDREGPLFSLPEGAHPATIYLSLAPGQEAAWITASTLDGSKAALLREGGSPLVLGVPLCPAGAPQGGRSC